MAVGTSGDGAVDLGPPVDDKGRYRLLIDGAWVDAASDRVHPNEDPARRGRIFGYVPEATKDEVGRACEAAERDFDAWRATSADARAKIFFRFLELLKQHEDALVTTMTREMGKSLYDARLDVQEAIGVVEQVAPQALGATGVTYPSIVRGIHMESRLSPRGVAAIITPFNFPVAIPVAQVVAALVTGNTVVWKPAHLAPECAQLIALLVLRAFRDCEGRWIDRVPPGVFHVVHGDESTGDALIRHPAVRTLSFTGSKQVGDAVDAVASGLGKRVMKEVAGINCFYVHASADLGRAARNFVYGKTITSGQRCTSIQEALVDRSVRDAFVAEVEALLPGIAYGPGDAPELAEADAEPGRFSLPPVVTPASRDRILAWIDRSVSEGGRVLMQQPVPAALAAEGCYVPFTVVTDVSPGNILYDHEIFGPVAVLTPVEGLAEAIALINAKTGIVGCIDARDKDATETFIDRVLRTRIDDGRHGTGCFWGTKFGGDRGAGSGNPALDRDMVMGYLVWKTIYRAWEPRA